MSKILESLDEEQRDLIVRHFELVKEFNKKVNLTRIDDDDEGYLLHIEDSLTALQELEDAPEGLYGDMGTGAGYPGIPLAIVSGRDTVLIDSRKKKVDALQEMIFQLGLSEKIRTYAGRAELLARTEPGSFSALTARALAPLSVLMELASPLLKKNGRLICFKSHVDDEEYNHAVDLSEKFGMKLAADRSFMLENTYDRRLLVFEKYKKPSVKLPRLEGQAQKNPF